jgi:hypothetical protein
LRVILLLSRFFTVIVFRYYKSIAASSFQKFCKNLCHVSLEGPPGWSAAGQSADAQSDEESSAYSS